MANLPNLAGIITQAIQGLGDTASSIIKDFKADPNKLIDADTRAKELQEKLAEVQLQVNSALEQEYTKQQAQVNETMQTEDKSEHFLTYSWRPVIGYIFGGQCLLITAAITFIGIRIGMGYDMPKDAINNLSGLFQSLFVLFGAEGTILGAASIFRGMKQVQEVKN